MHGGLSPGAPKGNQRAYKHGRYSAEAIPAAWTVGPDPSGPGARREAV